MNLRRALTAAPLALLVAFTAHGIGFGSGHLLGGDAGLDVLRLLLGGLGLAAASAALAAALGARDRWTVVNAARALARALPASGRIVPLAGYLGLTGAGLYVGLEFAEGHGLGAAPGWPLAIAIAALAVAAGTRLALTWLASAGCGLAALSEAIAAVLSSSYAPAQVAAPVHRSASHARLRRGRAPPSR